MVIQGYSVNVSSQRNFLSVQSTTTTTANSNNSAEFTGSTNQNQNVLGAYANNREQNQNDQGQNQNGQGQNQNGQGQNQNGQGQNQNNQGNNVNNQGQNQNNQRNNVNNQGQNEIGQDQKARDRRQSNRDAFRATLNNARAESINRLSKGSPVSHKHSAKTQRVPSTPLELRARLSQMIYELLTGKISKLKSHYQQHMEQMNQARSFDISTIFGGALGIGSVQHPQSAAGVNIESFIFEAETVHIRQTV